MLDECHIGVLMAGAQAGEIILVHNVETVQKVGGEQSR
jgi:hypothetical protein